MTRPRVLNFTSIVAILFLFSAIPAFAQRGGGSHGGGGFHGGGGGGFRSGGGGFGGGGFRGGSYSAPRAGYSRPAPSAPMRSGVGSYARPSGGYSSRSYANPGNRNQRTGNSFSAPRAMADGQWHSFGNAGVGRAGTPAVPQGRASDSAGGGFHVFSGNRSTGGIHSTRSFSGQGNQVWENAPTVHNVVSSSRARSNIRGSFGNPLAGNSGLRSSAFLSANSRIAGSSVFSNRIFSRGLGTNRGAFFGNRLGFGNSRFGYRGGCWSCGFGWGFGFGWWPGWGFGWPWLGYSYWDPFYWDDLTWGWPGYGYGYYGYPAGYPYGYDYGSYYNSYDDSSSYSASDDSYTGSDSSTVTSAPPQQSSLQTYSVANGAVPVLLFLKNGSVYSARDYWFSDDQFHYVLTNGREGAFDADQLDLRRTIDENAKSGVQFVVKSGASSPPPARYDINPPQDEVAPGDSGPAN